TGLVMYPRRPYSPTLGRFLTRDPIEESGGENLYAFVGNDPADWIDPLGLAAYGNDYKGAIDPEWDWIEPNYMQAEVEQVYASLATMDRHIYNPGLDNPLDYQQENAALLEKILGVPVIRVWNKTLGQGGHNLSQSGNKVVIATGDVLGTVGGKTDFLVAGFDKLPVPLASNLDQAVRLTRSTYEHALADVSGTGGRVYGWMHSEGAIHGSEALNECDKSQLRQIVVNTLGAGSFAFKEEVQVKHWINRNKNGTRDPVPLLAAGDWRPSESTPLVRHIPFVRKIVLKPGEGHINYIPNAERVITSYSSFGSPTYVHGFPTYAKYAIVPLSKDYFQRNARQILGK
ncbi:MAG: RHS repeat-associated core domain-containing protein, partial [Lentisphaerae bacterium]|nr:RHS repeat-associated core domain-containing protein [Lentisphaerota bacterium]